MAAADLVNRVLARAGLELHRAGWVPDDTRLYREVYGEDAVRERRFYNIGAGRFAHACWTNVDLQSDWYAHDQGGGVGIDWDLMACTPLPIADGTAELIYTSHTVEHVTNEADANLFAEAHRVLRPGGILRVTTPNIWLSYRAYRDRDRSFWYWADAHSPDGEWQRLKHTMPMNTWSLQQLLVYDFATNAAVVHADGAPDPLSDAEVDQLFGDLPLEDALDACLARCSLEVHRRNPQDHINWWTWPKMERMLRAAGFTDVRLSGYLQSHAPVLRQKAFFDTRFPPISLYVEATR